jgi:hypothetical protein
MQRRTGRLRTGIAAAALALTALAASTAALARPAADDLQLGIVVTTANSANVVSSLAFELDFHVSTDGGPQIVTLTFSLPSGLRFTNPPTSAEGCQLGPPVVCRVSPSTNEAGSLEFRKRFGIAAEGSGTYEVTGSVEGDRPDPDPSNNSRTYRFEVNASSGGGGGAAEEAAEAEAEAEGVVQPRRRPAPQRSHPPSRRQAGRSPPACT